MPSTPDFMCPALEASGDAKIGYLKEVLQESQSYLQNQPPWSDIDRAINIVHSPDDSLNMGRSFSRARINAIGIGIDQVTSAISNLRPLWGYKTYAKDDQAKAHARLLNIAMTSAWNTEFMDVSIKKALDHAAIEGTGYLSPQWVAPRWGMEKPRLKLLTFGAKEVFPFMMGNGHDIQQAYIVVTKQVVPLFEAKMMYPEASQYIVPDGSSPTYLTKGYNAVRKFIGSLYSMMSRSGQEDVSPNGPLVTIYTAYINDTSINTTDQEITMGDADTSWSYSVPYLGQETFITTGPKGPIYSKAQREQCLLYPQRRRIVFTSYCVLEDGPSIYWHGQVPVIPVYLKKLPYWYLGISLTHDTASLQSTMNQLLRNYIDNLEVGLDPPIQYDKGNIAKATMERLRLRRPNQKIGVNMSMGDSIKPILPPGSLRPDAQVPQTIKDLKEMIGEILGINDAKAMLRARQMPGGDAIEKLMEAIGPVQRSRNRRLEESLRGVGEQCKWIFFQYYTFGQRLSLYGNDGVFQEDIDMDPDSLIPSHAVGEDTLNPSKVNKFQRAKDHASQFTFEVQANSLDQLNQTTRKLMLTNLWKLNNGVPFYGVSPKMLAEAYDIWNFGELEGETQVEQTLNYMITIQKIQALIAQGMQGGQPGAGGGAPPGPPPLGGASPPKGRPQTNQQPPVLKQKTDGTAVTTTGKR